MIVDDFRRFKVSKFLNTKSSVKTAAALESYIATYITPELVSICAVRTDHGGEFEGEFQRKLDQLGIQHQHTPPNMPKYNGVAKQWIELLREWTIALRGDLEKLAADLRKEKYWAKAWNYSTDMKNMCATAFNENGITPYHMWYSRSPSLNLLYPFGTVGYLRRMKREHMLAPRGEKCLMMGIAQNHPRSIFRVINVKTGEIAIR